MLMGLMTRTIANSGTNEIGDVGSKLFKMASGEAFKRDEQGNRPEPLAPRRDIDTFFDDHPRLKSIALQCAGALAGVKGSEPVYDMARDGADKLNAFQERLTDALERNGGSISKAVEEQGVVTAFKELSSAPEDTISNRSRLSLEEEQEMTNQNEQGLPFKR